MKPLSLRELKQDERKTLAQWQHARTVSAELRQRVTIIGLAADGLHAPAIAHELRNEQLKSSEHA